MGGFERLSITEYGDLNRKPSYGNTLRFRIHVYIRFVLSDGQLHAVERADHIDQVRR